MGVDTLDINPIVATDIGKSVFCLYPACPTADIGILASLGNTTGTYVVRFPGTDEGVAIDSKFLVVVNV